MPKFSRRAFLQLLSAVPVVALLPYIPAEPEANVAYCFQSHADWGTVKLPPLRPMWFGNNPDVVTVEHGELGQIMGLDTGSGKLRVVGTFTTMPTYITVNDKPLSEAQMRRLMALGCPFDLHVNPAVELTALG